MNHEEFIKKIILDRPGIKESYSKERLKFQIASMIIDLRKEHNLTQIQLARLIGTKQPSIARIEKAQYLASLNILCKIADALNIELSAPQFIDFDETPLRENFRFSYPMNNILPNVVGLFFNTVKDCASNIAFTSNSNSIDINIDGRIA